MKILIIFSLFFTSIIYGQDNSVKHRPRNLDEAILELTKIHNDTTKQKILLMTEDEFTSGAHLGLGMWIRNNWGLWKGESLADYFHSIGIYHPDDMSGIILTSYYRYLHNQPRELEKQVKFYQDYWKTSKEHYLKLETDTSYQRRVKEVQDSLAHVQVELKKIEWKPGTVISGYVTYKCGFFVNLTKITGVIQEWKNDKIALKVTKYFEPKRKRGVIKCNNINEDIIVLDDYRDFKIEK